MHPADPLSLRLFIAVCECGSIAKAAEREYIAPSALSKRLADLEQTFGIPLLTRGQRGVRPTAAGEALLQHAAPILRSLQRLHVEVSEHAEGLRGSVRVLAANSVIAQSLPDELSDFLQQHEQVQIVLEERNSSEVVRGIADCVGEIGICLAFPRNDDVDSVFYGSDHAAVVVGSKHPLAGRSVLSFAETLDYEHVAIGIDAALRKQLERLAADLGKEVKYRFFTSRRDAALRVIGRGLAIGVFSGESVQRFSELLEVRVIPLSDSWAKREFVICTNRTDPLSPAARKLIQHLLSSSRGA